MLIDPMISNSDGKRALRTHAMHVGRDAQFVQPQALARGAARGARDQSEQEHCSSLKFLISRELRMTSSFAG